MTSTPNELSKLTGPVRVVVPLRDIASSRLIEAWRGQFAKLGREAEFVEVDATAIGVGDALRSGCAGNEAPVVMFLVPDWPFRPTDLKALLDAADTADCVVGVRAGQKRSPWHERLSRVGRFLQRVVFGIPAGEAREWYGWAQWRERLRYHFIYGLRLQDPGCGLVLLRKEVLDRCPLQSNGQFVLVELLAKANFIGALVAEVKLYRAGDMPAMKVPFPIEPTDAGRVFRKPLFQDTTKTTAGTDEPVPAAIEQLLAPDHCSGLDV